MKNEETNKLTHEVPFLHSSLCILPSFDMPIIVNLDVVLAQRKMRLNDLADGRGHHAAKPVHPQNRQGQGHPFLHARSHLQTLELPAGGNFGIPP